MDKTMRPSTKVTAVGLTGALVTIIVAVARQAGVELTGEVVGVLSTVISFVVGYFVKETNPSRSALEALDRTA